MQTSINQSLVMAEIKMNIIKKQWLKSLVKERRLTPAERLSSRLGYMGSAFIMLSPYILNYGSIGTVTYILVGLLLTPQVWIAKQWNLVIININLVIGYTIYILL